jgi:hypothetical protein
VDLITALNEQIRQIEAACALFDSGDNWESLKVAAPLKVIFGGSPGTPSLLVQMNKRFLTMVSTALVYPDTLTNWPAPNLTSLRQRADITTMFTCVANLGTSRVKKETPVDRWWNGETVFQQGHHKIRRRDLVLYALNRLKLSGPDTSLPATYRDLIEGMATHPQFLPPNAPHAIVPLHFAHYAALRQIAYETMNSPELTKLARPKAS